MKILQIGDKSKILIGETLSNLDHYIFDKRSANITDLYLDKYYGAGFPDIPKIVIPAGESTKTLQTIQQIINKLIDFEVDRHRFLVGIGGDVVCDIAGFVASTYIRGLEFGFVSTSLRSQVDASVGGKNGINFHSYKTPVGNCNQPDFVICALEMLNTLPKDHLRSGMGEIVKHSFIADAQMLDFIDIHYAIILNIETDIIENLVYNNVTIKAGFVEKDQKEQGERKELNFGHTLAHAIEKCSSEYSHGEAVALGIVFASKISLEKQYFSQKEYHSTLEVLDKLALPTKLTIDKQLIAHAICKDKKRNNTRISLVLLDGIGKAKIEDIPVNDIKQYSYDLC